MRPEEPAPDNQFKRTPLESIPDIIVRFDRFGRHLHVSPNICELLGVEASEVTGKTARELGLPEENCKLGDRMIAQVFETGRAVETDIEIEIPGRPKVLNVRMLPEMDANLRVETALMMCRDVSAERRLEADYRNLFDKMLEGFAVHEMLFDEQGRPVDYRFVAINPSFEQMTGLKARDLVGRRVLEVMPDLEPEWVARYGRVVETGESARFENYARHLGKHFEVLAFRPRPGQFACVFHDVTASKRAEQERALLQEQFLQAQKLESIGRLAGGVAHDFNNLLTIINGHSTVALDGMDVAHPLRDSLQEIQQAGERAAALVRQLLAFSRKQVWCRQVLNLNEEIRAMERTLLHLVGEDVDIVTSLEEGLQPVLADRHQIAQVLMNLVVNARDAMPRGGTLTIETSNVPDGQLAAQVRVTIRDTGEGMEAETLEHVFEPFFTTKEVGKGTGLGLATVQGIILQSGGQVEVESTPGAGTAFHFFLPATREEAAVAEPAPAMEMRGNETVLLVEDQPEVRKFVRTVLAGYGYRVLEANGAEQALELLAANRVDLLLTDIVMPKVSGRELAARARASDPKLKVLFVSGYGGHLLPEELAGTGDGFVSKPFRPQELAAKVRELLGSGVQQGRILVVDDEASVRKVLRRVLEQAGYRVTEASNGKMAMGCLRESAVDLVITDLVMPEQEGIETIQQLRRDYSSIAIIALSGAGQGLYLAITEALGADSSLAKPVAPDVLLAEVRRVLAGRRSVDGRA